MPKYEYRDESFVVGEQDACAIKVSDQYGKTATISVTVRGSNNYYVSTPAKAARAGSPESAVRQACDALIAARSFPSRESVCEDLHQFVKNLES